MTAPTTSPDTGGEALGSVPRELLVRARHIVGDRAAGGRMTTSREAASRVWNDLLSADLATPRKAEGVLVPREPTEAMIDAGRSAFMAAGPWAFHRFYRAMLDAAPTAGVK